MKVYPDEDFYNDDYQGRTPQQAADSMKSMILSVAIIAVMLFLGWLSNKF